jgi:DNA-binding helix-hairpin-helix protein with protein kinase domain
VGAQIRVRFLFEDTHPFSSIFSILQNGAALEAAPP